jgi:hypothetical protein
MKIETNFFNSENPLKEMENFVTEKISLANRTEKERIKKKGTFKERLISMFNKSDNYCIFYVYLYTTFIKDEIKLCTPYEIEKKMGISRQSFQDIQHLLVEMNILISELRGGRGNKRTILSLNNKPLFLEYYFILQKILIIKRTHNEVKNATENI